MSVYVYTHVLYGSVGNMYYRISQLQRMNRRKNNKYYYYFFLPNVKPWCIGPLQSSSNFKKWIASPSSFAGNKKPKEFSRKFKELGFKNK